MEAKTPTTVRSQKVGARKRPRLAENEASDDVEKALKAAGLGDAASCYELGIKAYDVDDLKVAISYFEKGVNLSKGGDGRCYHYLGICKQLDNQTVDDRVDEDVVRCFQNAAKLNVPMAIYDLAFVYDSGSNLWILINLSQIDHFCITGIKSDIAKAYDLYSKLEKMDSGAVPPDFKSTKTLLELEIEQSLTADFRASRLFCLMKQYLRGVEWPSEKTKEMQKKLFEFISDHEEDPTPIRFTSGVCWHFWARLPVNNHEEVKMVRNIFKFLIRNGALAYINYVDPQGRTPVHIAVLYGAILQVAYFVEEESTELDYYDFDGDTPLLAALKHQRLDIVEKLLEYVPHRINWDAASQFPEFGTATAATWIRHKYATDQNRLDVTELIEDLDRTMQCYKLGVKLNLPSILDRIFPKTLIIIIADYF